MAHLQSVYPLEGCGLMGGADGRVLQHYPVDNRLNSPSAFELEPAQLVAAMMNMEDRGLTLTAVYHSHPNGPAVPSPTDVRQANYPEAMQIIVSFEVPDQPEAAAFRIADGRISPAILKVV